MKDFVKKAGQIIAVLCLSLLVLGAEKMEALGADTRQITELDGSKAAGRTMAMRKPFSVRRETGSIF